MSIVVTLGKPTWCNGSTLAQNAKDVGLSHALGTVFPIFPLGTATSVVGVMMILST